MTITNWLITVHNCSRDFWGKSFIDRHQMQKLGESQPLRRRTMRTPKTRYDLWFPTKSMSVELHKLHLANVFAKVVGLREFLCWLNQESIMDGYGSYGSNYVKLAPFIGMPSAKGFGQVVLTAFGKCQKSPRLEEEAPHATAQARGAWKRKIMQCCASTDLKL